VEASRGGSRRRDGSSPREIPMRPRAGSGGSSGAARQGAAAARAVTLMPGERR
jgi:hypothetical protein